MFEIILMCILLIISLLIVIKAADLFVDNIVEIGTALGISQILLGVTAAAIGTSLPEFGSALIASLSGNTEMGVGVVIGSNIWNVAGIFGITATITGLVQADKKSINRDGLMAVVTGLVLLAFMLFGYFTGELYISGFSSIIMIIFYIYYMRILVKDQEKEHKDKIEEDFNNKKDVKNTEDVSNEKLSNKRNSINKKSILFVLLGIIGLGVGCQLLITSASSLATTFGIPPAIMGLFTLSIGTSIPELVVTLSSAMKGLHDLSMGTVFGSVTFNILVGIGIPALLVAVPIEPLSLYFDAPVMIGVTAGTLLLMKYNKNRLNRFSGIILLGVYVLYAFLRIFVLG
ncbi:MAG: calcium/sodium antiporter [Methanobrevibacter sp.]|uniref:calcium/sodium antiporter n=1 Tax=Methanobrevibacter sp. TaxID=66852 RepID=UPI0026042C88|nr:calcium/sodium antiporter [Methanobrevibacter sp.]MEA4956304.1 calcium/sodium antiporter [Methanobrevibacter sp.]